MENIKSIRFLIPLIVAVILGVFLFTFPHFSRLCELKVYDLKMRLSAKSKDKSIADRIKIINISDDTIKQMGWPKKSDHAHLINILTQHKVSLIVYDWIFHQRDDELIQSAKNSNRVIWPVSFDLDSKYGRRKYSNDLFTLLEKSFLGIKLEGLWKTTTVNMSHPQIMQSAAGIGHISARNEEGNPLNDGVYRKMALVVNFSDYVFPSMTLIAACNYLHVELGNVRVIPGREIVLHNATFPDGRIKDVHIPVNKRGEMWIYFPGKWQENYFEPFWFENVLSSHSDKSRWGEYDRKFSDTVCFVGNASSKSKDVHNIPMEDNFPGVGIHAAALFTILSGNFISFSNPIFDVLIILLLALAVGGVSNYLKPLSASAFHILMAVGYAVATFWIFAKYRICISTVFPTIAVLMGGAANLGYQFFMEQGEKDFLVHEYGVVQLELKQKNNHIKQLASEKQKTDVQLKYLAVLKGEKENIVEKMNILENKVESLKDVSHQVLQGEVKLEKYWENLQKECLNAGIITRNRKMLEIFEQVKTIANTSLSVLITGESGTGKKLIANAMHNLSSRKELRIQTVVISTIPEGLVESALFGHKKGAFTGANEDKEGFFEKANGSTLFLDEIGEIPPYIQSKLLEVLEKGEYNRVGDTSQYRVDVRVVAATNRNIEEEIKEGNFKSDLYYRLNGMSLEFPPLRERKDDIELLAEYFIKKYVQKDKKRTMKLSQKAVETLMSYNWPGNIRELENVIHRAVALTNEELINEVSLKLTVPKASIKHIETPSPEYLSDVSGDLAFLNILNQNQFSISKTSNELEINRNTVTSRLKGVCIKALVENDWNINKAAKDMGQNPANVKVVESKIKEYYENILKDSEGYSSLKEFKRQVDKKYKNTPKKFHKYILKVYDRKDDKSEDTF